MVWKKEILSLVTTGVISIILGSFGGSILKENILIGITTILVAFVLLIFVYHIFQIRDNQNKIAEIMEWKRNKEEVLNTFRDIVILRKSGGLK